VPATKDDVARLRAAYDVLRSGDLAPMAPLMDDKIPGSATLAWAIRRRSAPAARKRWSFSNAPPIGCR
jgi:hypothetical protein